MRHVLVVANQTLHGDALLEALKGKLESGPCHFFVLVPATPIRDHLWVPVVAPPSHIASGLDSAAAPDEEQRAYAVAEQRLEHAVARLRALGAPVEGEVGDSDPSRAVAAVVSRQPVDEVVISTLPAHASRWLRTDLAGRVRRKHHLPVTTITHDPVPAHA